MGITTGFKVGDAVCTATGCRVGETDRGAPMGKLPEPELLGLADAGEDAGIETGEKETGALAG